MFVYRFWGQFQVDSFRKNFLTNVLLLMKIGVHVNFVEICVFRKIFLKNFRKFDSNHIVVGLYEVLKKNLTKSTKFL